MKALAKKTVLLLGVLLLTVFLAACSDSETLQTEADDATAEETVIAPQSHIDFENIEVKESANYADANLANSQFTDLSWFTAIPDSETAVIVADAIINPNGILYPHYVTYDPANEIWSVEFTDQPADQPPDYPGGGVIIILKKSNAEVIAILPCE